MAAVAPLRTYGGASRLSSGAVARRFGRLDGLMAWRSSHFKLRLSTLVKGVTNNASAGYSSHRL